MTTEHKLPNKEECICEEDNKLTQAMCPLHGAPGYRASPSDKTWEERFRNLAPNGLVELVDFEGTKPVFDFIQQEITSATIKAKEEVLRGLILERIDVGPSVKNEVKHVLAIEVLEYAKSIGINLEEPIKVIESKPK